MLRKIIKIDERLCNGCGLCVDACHEGAIGLIAGRARLLRDDYCDGLGDCLPVCPTNAISFEEREALEYNEAEVLAKGKLPCGCPGSNAKTINRKDTEALELEQAAVGQPLASELNQWPVQIKLAPANASYFENADLLISADCAAYAYGDFHCKFMKNRVVLIGCPKLDDVDYSEKLTAIIANNSIKSVTVVRMEVPCCGGIQKAVEQALKNSGKILPYQIITLSVDGQII